MLEGLRREAAHRAHGAECLRAHGRRVGEGVLVPVGEPLDDAHERVHDEAEPAEERAEDDEGELPRDNEHQHDAREHLDQADEALVESLRRRLLHQERVGAQARDQVARFVRVEEAHFLREQVVVQPAA